MEQTFGNIISYLLEERFESELYMVIGILSILFSLFFYQVISYNFFKGLAVSFFMVGFFKFIYGLQKFHRASENLIYFNALIKHNSLEIEFADVFFAARIRNSFFEMNIAGFLLLIIGIILFFKHLNSTQKFWRGIGLGLCFQACILLTLNFVADKNYEDISKICTTKIKIV
jgi:uncharacterized membrane protein HdeD (DUF308 family)